MTNCVENPPAILKPVERDKRPAKLRVRTSLLIT
jgi:hypothetical protein